FMESLIKIGGWTYDPERLVVTYRVTTSYVYEVDLEQCTTSAEMLDWIFQVAKKTWARGEVVRDLVKILNKLLRPQGTLCSFGVESGPLPAGDATRDLIDNHIEGKETFNQAATSEDWQNLLRMEKDDLPHSAN